MIKNNSSFKITLKALGPVLLVLALGGCYGTSGIKAGAASVDVSPSPLPEVTKRFRYENQALAWDVKIVDAKLVAVGALMKGIAQIQSTTNSSLKLQYRFTWYDSNGIDINPGGLPWQPIFLHGREETALQSVGPHSGAKDFSVTIRRVD